MKWRGRDAFALVAAAVLGWMAAAAVATETPAPSITVETGTLVGSVEGGAESWKGIPFAAPPIGPLRWRAPQPAAPWSGVRQATAYVTVFGESAGGRSINTLVTSPMAQGLFATALIMSGGLTQKPPSFGVDAFERRVRMRRERKSDAVPIGHAPCGLGAAGSVTAQALKDLQTPDTPLVLKAQGSFYVGGEKSEQTQVQLGSLGPGGHITVTDVRAVHGAPGRRRERAGGDGPRRDPDRKVVGDDTGRSHGGGRVLRAQGAPRLRPGPGGSRAIGLQPGRLQRRARARRRRPANPSGCASATRACGPTSDSGRSLASPSSDSQFPVTAVDELSKQGVPDVSLGGLPTPNPNFKALSDLAGQLSGAVLMGHSQSGSFPLEAALLNPVATRVWCSSSRGRCPAYSPEQIATLVKVPILVVFGDHRDNPTAGVPMLPTWQARFEACQALIARLRSAGGQAEMLNPPERGIRGNSHMIMQDKNHLQIADLILQWIGEHARKPRAGTK